MTLGDLTQAQFLERLENGELAWRVGPYSIRVQTDLPDVAAGVRFLYSRFPLVESGEIVDAEVRVLARSPLRRRVRIEVDGEIQYDRLPRNLAIPMVEWALNVNVFHRSHQYFMLHAAVVEKGSRALLLSGHAGSGKSTLCAALAHRGWRLLSDEVALISPEDGQIRPVPRPVSLKEGSIGAIRQWAPDAELGPEWPNTAKGTVAHMLPPADSVARADETAEAAWLIFPRFDPLKATGLRRLPKARAFLRAAEDAFNYSVLGRVGFESLATLIDRSQCFELAFSDLETAVGQLDSVTSATPVD